MRICLFLLSCFSTLLFAACAGSSKPAPVIDGDKVVVSGGQLEYEFTRKDDFSESYMVFGGMAIDHKNAVNEVTISGLSMVDARAIHHRYPDFTKCSSAGATLAQRAIVQLDIVPISADVRAKLVEVLDQHEESIEQGGDRVCVELRGSVLELTGAREPESGTDIFNQLPRQLRHDYYLVESAKLQGAQVLAAGL
jgi:hypothetical protein